MLLLSFNALASQLPSTTRDLHVVYPCFDFDSFFLVSMFLLFTC